MIAINELTLEQAQAVVRDCFGDLLVRADRQRGFVAETDAPELELIEQREMSRERIVALRQELLSSGFSSIVHGPAKIAVEKHGLKLDDLSEGSQLDVLSGVARALIEEQRLYQLRLTDRLAPFAPCDPLFLTSQIQPSRHALINPETGHSVGKAVAEYLKEGESRWTRKTHNARIWQLRFFAEHVGADLALAAVTVEHVRSFRDSVRCLHRAHGRTGGTFAQRQTPSIQHRISNKTAAVTFEPIKAFFRWARSVDGWISVDPSNGISLVAAKASKGGKSRRPFMAAELKALFGSPIYRGCRSRHRRYEPGHCKIYDAKFWIPVLGLYTGARLGELIQLHFADVNLDGPVPYIAINEDNGPGTTLADRKHVKSAAAIRKIPLHPDVLALGFAAFVASRKKNRGKSRIRLFHEFPFGSDGQASTVASKWFARFMDSVGLKDRALVFHSFRHSVEDAFRNAGLPKYTIDQIVGHSDPSTSAVYGEGVNLAVAYEAVKAMALPISLSELLSTASDGFGARADGL